MPSSSPVIEIFDRTRVRFNRERAEQNSSDHDFLLHWASRNLADRLDDIKRIFPLALQIGGRCNPFLDEKPSIEQAFIMDLAPLADIHIQADEERLPFAQHSIDLVVSPLSLQSVNDLPGTLIQINRALKPDGLFLAAMFGGETLFELRQSLMQADIAIKGGAGPRVAPFADKQQVGALMQRAGFALPVVDSEIITVTYGEIKKLMHDLRYMGEGAAMREGRRPLTRTILKETERIYSKKFSEEDGRLRATFEIIFMIGWAPHNSQQKPLRPGSAKTRLADALSAKEIKT